MVRWVVGSILHGGGGPLSYFSFQPVLHDWCNKGRGMWDGAYKRTLAANRKEYVMWRRLVSSLAI